MNFAEELEKLGNLFAEELYKNFECYDAPVIQKEFRDKHAMGYLTKQIAYQSVVIQFRNFKFRWGIDEELHDWSMTAAGLTIVPNKSKMVKVVNQTMKQWPENIPVIVAELKLGGVWGILLPGTHEVRKPNSEKFSQLFFRGPLITEDCATPKGGSIDFVWHIPIIRVFTDNKTFFKTLEDGMMI